VGQAAGLYIMVRESRTNAKGTGEDKNSEHVSCCVAIQQGERDIMMRESRTKANELFL